MYVCFCFLYWLVTDKFVTTIITDLKFTNLDACSEYGYGGSDLSEDEINFFQGQYCIVFIDNSQY